MKLGYETNNWGGVVGHPVGVTSIKDLFYLTPGPLEPALRDIAAAGYQGFEVFDGNLMEYAGRKNEFRALMRDTGLQLLAVYSGANFIFPEILEEELWRVDKAAALAAEFGAIHLVVGGGAKRAAGNPDSDYDRMAAGLDRVEEIAARYGLTPSYHPHLTTIVEGPDQLEKVMSRTRIGLCPDTAHLAAGGCDVAEVIRRYRDRLPYVHLKDWNPEPFSFLPLGQGKLDMAGIIRALQEVGYDGWITVEADGYAGVPLEGARISKAFLDQF